MLKMRPFQIILISVFVVLALVGLYVFSTYSGIGGGPQVGTVLIWGTLPQKAMDDALATLKVGHREYAGVTYKFIAPDGFDDALANALAAGTGPDLVVINQEELYADAPKLSQIPFSSIPKGTYIKDYVALDEMYLTSTGTYGIPLVVDPLVLYYNRSMLSSVGIPTPPTTWEQVFGLAPSMTKLDANQHITQSTVAFGTYSNVTNARAILSTLFLQSGTPITQINSNVLRSVLGDTNTNTDSGNSGNTPAQGALNFYVQFANPGSPVYSWNQSMPSSRQAFVSGDLAFYLGYASEEPGLKAANPNLDFDMAPIPQPQSATTRTTYGLGYALVIPKVGKNQAGAYTIATVLTAPAIVSALATELGMAPANRTLLTPNGNDPFASIYYPEALNAQGWVSPAPSVVDSVFSVMISNMITGRTQTQGALTSADQSFNAAFNH